ncbi:LuxR C-terminal-related transcriptional regulator [Lentzea sp. BCCO 10_0061]|uniref:LuxR C-terminal-related transcriptional regulator n=1 Tax=Lentzea sokolovensis TaxID=3095429 RepID=A0ABU4V2F6_9PSEU|nr:LuxR C-terminal-related transcriptional regulator [Lentzea sp. BCCO 10_0061]MDX8145975.1 LuxR C-terminal-related transcriptional regulator [Lentzea sp. BCCO 10_0061]
MLSRFIGRTKLLADLHELIAEHRLVTLTGTGGSGKTRLAAEITGTTFVELATIGRPEMLARRIAEVLEVEDRSARDIAEVLRDHLAGRKTVLVLDNCEHLRDAVAELAACLLDGAPGLKILATSRERLGVPGERVLVVPPLDVPPPNARMSTDYESVALLADRAPDSLLTERNWPDVVRLLHRVAGLPLAIELAAVRLRAMPLHEVVKRLDDEMKLLTRNDRVALPHHRTLRAVIDWSHDLCTPSEQRLWAQVSVFAGGWDLAAAEAVGDSEDVLDDLAGLVAKSIVTFEDDRYHLLEPLRQYGAERLGADRDAVLRRHLEHFADLVRRVGEGWFTDDELIGALRVEMANVEVALETSLCEPGRALELEFQLARMHSAFFASGWPEQYRRLRRALETGADDHWHLDALAFAGSLALALGRTEESAELLSEAKRRDSTFSGVLYLRGEQQWLLHGDHGALVTMRAARDRAEPDRRAIFSVQVAMASALLAGESEAGADLADLEKMLDGNQITTAGLLVARGVAELRFGSPDQACDLLRQALERQRASGDQWGPVWAVEALAWATAATGNARRAARLLGASEAVQRLTGRSIAAHETFRQMRTQAVARARCPEYGREHAAGAALKSFDEVYADVFDEHAGPLTPAQLEVAKLVAAGLTNREIAARLHKSQRTVETQVQQIFAALGVHRRVMIAQRINVR